jgi:hypothetical protein
MAFIPAVATDDYNKRRIAFDRECFCACRVQDSDWSQREWLEGCKIFTDSLVAHALHSVVAGFI